MGTRKTSYRANFEAWAIKRFGPGLSFQREKDKPDNYDDLFIQMFWLGWCAAVSYICTITDDHETGSD